MFMLVYLCVYPSTYTSVSFLSAFLHVLNLFNDVLYMSMNMCMHVCKIISDISTFAIQLYSTVWKNPLSKQLRWKAPLTSENNIHEK